MISHLEGYHREGERLVSLDQEVIEPPHLVGNPQVGFNDFGHLLSFLTYLEEEGIEFRRWGGKSWESEELGPSEERVASAKKHFLNHTVPQHINIAHIYRGWDISEDEVVIYRSKLLTQELARFNQRYPELVTLLLLDDDEGHISMDYKWEITSHRPDKLWIRLVYQVNPPFIKDGNDARERLRQIQQEGREGKIGRLWKVVDDWATGEGHTSLAEANRIKSEEEEERLKRFVLRAKALGGESVWEANASIDRRKVRRDAHFSIPSWVESARGIESLGYSLMVTEDLHLLLEEMPKGGLDNKLIIGPRYIDHQEGEPFPAIKIILFHPDSSEALEIVRQATEILRKV